MTRHSYVYSATQVVERFALFARHFTNMPHLVCYAVKANSNVHLLRLLAKQGAGFDIVSGGELERVLFADTKAAKRIVFSGVGKTSEEIDLALQVRHPALQCGERAGTGADCRARRETEA